MSQPLKVVSLRLAVFVFIRLLVSLSLCLTFLSSSLRKLVRLAQNRSYKDYDFVCFFYIVIEISFQEAVEYEYNMKFIISNKIILFVDVIYSQLRQLHFV